MEPFKEGLLSEWREMLSTLIGRREEEQATFSW